MKKILAICFVVILFNGCYYDNLEELHPAAKPCDTTGTISFANDIIPIMISGCGAQRSDCHQNDQSTSHYGLATYDDVQFTIDDNGEVFLQCIKHDPALASSKWMPKGSTAKIDKCSIEKIEVWINRGRNNN